jgi:hypothetical protein
VEVRGGGDGVVVDDDDEKTKKTQGRLTAGGSVVKEGLKPLYSD